MWLRVARAAIMLFGPGASRSGRLHRADRGRSERITGKALKFWSPLEETSGSAVGTLSQTSYLTFTRLRGRQRNTHFSSNSSRTVTLAGRFVVVSLPECPLFGETIKIDIVKTDGRRKG
ncbi:UDP-N-acetylmuramoylalanyl-D-glutamate--2, 6-diaminopimelate ligase [Anopheles sinensis]|uniref:UDP-N-acetylmuramoylalanyl-D-glutamate--2, 6-diaminopimelate ligase n=1 Tax=Anopheles sinensis TaxID=74873 RepID=A0A084W2Q2_ANOSI|nr:UDP-N-acetylmuramoylalanyl-D-glutamate--2, 6-diaminopimelate ligase [Anopheles sinensis]